MGGMNTMSVQEEDMEPISEEFVEETWQEVALLTPDRAQKEMDRMGTNQPDLLAFLMASTDNVKSDVQGLGFYLAFVVYRMFEGFRKTIKKISSKEIIAFYQDNIDLIQSLEGAHDKVLERIAEKQVSSQPYVMQYVVEALMEEPDEEGMIELTEEDRGFLFILLKTVVEVLDKKSHA